VHDGRGAGCAPPVTNLTPPCLALRVGIDSIKGARTLARYTGGGGAFEVLIEIDSGHHRTGVPPKDTGDVAVAVALAGLLVRGVFTFPGHSYSPGLAAGAAADEAQALEQAAAVLRAAGVPVDVLSGGSTPTAALATSGALTEIRPCVYVFGDAQQLELGTCAVGDVALTAAATVVSHAPGRVVLDAGSKVLGADRPVWTTGFGRLPDYPDARLSALSEHHATKQIDDQLLVVVDLVHVWVEAEKQVEGGFGLDAVHTGDTAKCLPGVLALFPQPSAGLKQGGDGGPVAQRALDSVLAGDVWGTASCSPGAPALRGTRPPHTWGP